MRVKDGGLEKWAMADSYNDSVERMIDFLEAKEVIGGDYVKLFLSKQLKDLVGSYLGKSRMLNDAFVSLEAAIEPKRVEAFGPIESIQYHLREACLKLELLIMDSIEKDAIAKLSQRQKDLYNVYVKNVGYARFLEMRSSARGPARSIEQAIKEENPELHEMIFKLEGESFAQKIRRLYDLLGPKQWENLYQVLKNEKIVSEPLDSYEREAWNTLRKAQKIAYKLMDEVEALTDQYQKDALLTVSPTPMEQLGLRSRIARKIFELNQRELETLAQIFLHKPRDALIDYLDLWPPGGPASINYERVCHQVIYQELSKRIPELPRNSKIEFHRWLEQSR